MISVQAAHFMLGSSFSKKFVLSSAGAEELWVRSVRAERKLSLCGDWVGWGCWVWSWWGRGGLCVRQERAVRALQVEGSQAVKQTDWAGEERGEQRLEAGRCWWEEGNGAGRGVFRKTGSVNSAANRAGGVTVSQVKSWAGLKYTWQDDEQQVYGLTTSSRTHMNRERDRNWDQEEKTNEDRERHTIIFSPRPHRGTWDHSNDVGDTFSAEGFQSVDAGW